MNIRRLPNRTAPGLRSWAAWLFARIILLGKGWLSDISHRQARPWPGFIHGWYVSKAIWPQLRLHSCAEWRAPGPI